MFYTQGPYAVRGNNLVSVCGAFVGERVVATVERPEDQKLFVEAPGMVALLKRALEDVTPSRSNEALLIEMQDAVNRAEGLVR